MWAASSISGRAPRALPPAVTNFGSARISVSGVRADAPLGFRTPASGATLPTFRAPEPMPRDDPPSFLPVAVPRAGRSRTTRFRHLFARAPLPVDANHPRPPAAGLYVDAENLPGGVQARRLIARTLDDWPSGLPPVRTLSVYVPADKMNAP